MAKGGQIGLFHLTIIRPFNTLAVQTRPSDPNEENMVVVIASPEGAAISLLLEIALSLRSSQ
jgi:hypothetical protein